MADQRPIIIKKKKGGGGHGHHGGAWKVAYADFVTAMMAFFLLLWLLNATTEEQKKGLAEYFAPTISLTSRGSGAAGLLQGGTVMKGNDSALSAADPNSKPEEPTDEANSAENQTDNSGQSKTEQVNETEEYSNKTGDPVEGLSKKEGDSLQAVIKEEEEAKFESAAAAIKAALESIPEFSDVKGAVQVKRTEKGLEIQLIDQDNYSMFESGSSNITPTSKALLSMIGVLLKDLPNKISIAGHTDASPFHGKDGSDNWDLSSARANASRRVLVEGGVDQSRISDVSGKADTEPYDKADPKSPKNRRITITLNNVDPKDVKQDQTAPAK
ncbi:MAG: OmpA family protein [Alphaproteobacteria bacterium]|nr:OmpA family protein [Alphaproteobacteria bacterium]MBP9878065.1 OmpA family protein [Alphaproteobacteria bacterium]